MLFDLYIVELYQPGSRRVGNLPRPEPQGGNTRGAEQTGRADN